MTESFSAQPWGKGLPENRASLFYLSNVVSDSFFTIKPPTSPEPRLLRARYWPHVRFLSREKVQQRSGKGSKVLEQIHLSGSELTRYLNLASDNVASQIPTGFQENDWEVLMNLVRNNLTYKCDPQNLYRNTIITWLTGPSEEMIKEEFKYL